LASRCTRSSPEITLFGVFSDDTSHLDYLIQLVVSQNDTHLSSVLELTGSLTSLGFVHSEMGFGVSSHSSCHIRRPASHRHHRAVLPGRGLRSCVAGILRS